ncbi:hypothetical protein [Dehalobacterium formicoaceticum]|uniref:Uncharacterized protein n=1 Tax=Dehalobacterium formicoaceticum TaxID=51515 RepID=A0ABT1Y3Z3_9FIRM|nr:hypothetical protein [Dehalobacterium formicoaceticum]MCR6545598.1 hypothetical protein [Dehalobacterium formicoaceticum]
MKKFWPAVFILFLVMVLLFSQGTFKNSPPQDAPQSSSSYWLVNAANNETLTHTSVSLSVGDEYIDSNNRVYRITKISEDKAYVERIE